MLYFSWTSGSDHFPIETLQVIGISRRTERIEELGSILSGPGKLFAIKCDVAREDEILKAFRWVLENIGPVSVLLNNAGLTRPTNLISKFQGTGEYQVWLYLGDVVI